jgi:type II secretory pathway component PulJ
MRRRRAGGYTLIEALLMVIILSIISIPVGNALVAAGRNTKGNEDALALDNALVSVMETVRATYASMPLGVQTSTVTVGNNSYPLTIDIEKQDPGTGTLQTSYLSLTVTIGGRTLTTYVSNL